MKIEINRMECYARHGVLPLENKVGAPFRVSLTLFVPDAACAGALRDDRLEDTVNYAEVAALVRREMALPSQLIEHVAERIASAVLKEFRKVNEVTVKIEKLSPPIAGFSAEGVSVELVKRRPLFVFDFDGTIADTRAGIVRTMQASFRTMHLPVPKAEEIVPTIGLPLTESIAKLGNLQGERLEQTVETYRRLFEEVGVEGIVLYDGMKEWLKTLHSEGAVLAIATSRGHESTEQLCQRLGIRPLFAEIVACDDVVHAKPHPEAVERLMRRHGISAEATTVVGDTTFDIEMGRRAGCHTIGVTWGNHSEQMLRQAGAEEIRR